MFYDVSHCFRSVSWWFTMCDNVLCSVSHATIGIAASATANRLRDRDNATRIGNNSAEISDNSAKIGDNSAEISDNSAEIGDDAAGQSAEYVKYTKIFGDCFLLIFITTEDLGDPFLLILYLLKILATHSCRFYAYWRSWRVNGDPFLLRWSANHFQVYTLWFNSNYYYFDGVNISLPIRTRVTLGNHVSIGNTIVG